MTDITLPDPIGVLSSYCSFHKCQKMLAVIMKCSSSKNLSPVLTSEITEYSENCKTSRKATKSWNQFCCVSMLMVSSGHIFCWAAPFARNDSFWMFKLPLYIQTSFSEVTIGDHKLSENMFSLFLAGWGEGGVALLFWFWYHTQWYWRITPVSVLCAIIPAPKAVGFEICPWAETAVRKEGRNSHNQGGPGSVIFCQCVSRPMVLGFLICKRRMKGVLIIAERVGNNMWESI